MIMLPRRFAPFVYGIIQSAITTGVATGIATFNAMGLDGFLVSWIAAWGLAWLTMVPVVIGISPLIQRAVDAMTVLEH